MSVHNLHPPRFAETSGDTTVPATMRPVRRLGKYTLGETLGEGAMGVVYRALDPDIDRMVALKTIRRALLDTPTGNQSAALRFRNEARAAGRLSHPGIVAIHEYGEEDGQNFIAMEYVEGASLLACTVPQQRLALADLLSVVTQLLHALNYAHAHGVWHRDIKPSNLLVTPGGQLKITDFGIARIDATVLTQDAEVMGSSGYMAPECYEGVELDQRVDIFACGVLLYELLTGRRPFVGAPGKVMHQLLHAESPPLVAPGCSAAEAAALAPFEAIVARALARDRSLRYPGAQEMLDALTAAAGQPVAPRVSVAGVQTLRAARSVATPATPASPQAIEPMPVPARVHMLPRKPQPIHHPVPSAAAPAPPPATEAPSFDDSLLAALEALLVPTMGPVARVMVRRAAACSHGVAALVARLANDLPTDAERRQFMTQAQRAIAKFSPRGVPTPLPQADSAPAPVATTSLAEGSVQRAEAALARHVGPIARVLVKRAAQQAGSREQFIATLTGLAADCVDPERLRIDLENAL